MVHDMVALRPKGFIGSLRCLHIGHICQAHQSVTFSTILARDSLARALARMVKQGGHTAQKALVDVRVAVRAAHGSVYLRAAVAFHHALSLKRDRHGCATRVARTRICYSVEAAHRCAATLSAVALLPTGTLAVVCRLHLRAVREAAVLVGHAVGTTHLDLWIIGARAVSLTIFTCPLAPLDAGAVGKAAVGVFRDGIRGAHVGFLSGTVAVCPAWSEVGSIKPWHAIHEAITAV
jgi:hypothetical protein